MLTPTVLKKFSIVAIGATAIAIGTVGSAHATSVTFDDLPQLRYDAKYISNGYAGFNWSNFAYTTGVKIAVSSGYETGTVSGTNVAFNAYGKPAAVSIDSGTFDFNSAYLTSAWNNGNEIAVEGLFNGESKYSQKVVVNTKKPIKFDFNFLGINQLKFSSSLAHFVMDNFTFNEPLSDCGVRH